MFERSPRDALASRYASLQKIIEFIQERLPKLPEGRLRINRHGNSVYYYFVAGNDDNNGKIISDKSLIQELAQRSYWEKVIKAARNEEKLISRIIDHYPDPTFEKIYDTLSDERKELIVPVVLTDERYIERWLGQEFRRKGFKEGMPVYMTLNGERVRSKSEQIIADRLKAKGIPYLYERPVKVGDKVFHTDFTILRMSDRKELYLEHLGRLGDQGYAADAVDRMNRYQMNGFVQGDNLFFTYESEDAPFDVRVLDVLIDEKFR